MREALLCLAHEQLVAVASRQGYRVSPVFWTTPASPRYLSPNIMELLMPCRRAGGKRATRLLRAHLAAAEKRVMAGLQRSAVRT